MHPSLTLKRLMTLVSAPLIWMAHFLVVYILVSLVCALQLTDSRVLGMNPADFGIAVATALALLLMIWIAVGSLRGWRTASGPDAEMDRFFALNTLLLCGLSLIALVWVAFPTLLLPSCAA